MLNQRFDDIELDHSVGFFKILLTESKRNYVAYEL